MNASYRTLWPWPAATLNSSILPLNNNNCPPLIQDFIVHSPHLMLLGSCMNEDEMREECSMQWQNDKCIQSFSWKISWKDVTWKTDTYNCIL
jgi:hypothetical protein